MFTLLRSLIQSLTGKNGRRAALMLALGAVSLRAAATDYYVSSTGSNSNPGTSTSPWQTIARVNSQVFLPGDRVLFEGGRTFAGPMLLDSGDGGSATDPVVVTSYGTGRATLNGGTGSALRLVAVTGAKVIQLNVVGDGRNTGNNQGVGVSIQRCSDVTVDYVDASGFQRCGIGMFSSANVKVIHVRAYLNGYAGILSHFDQTVTSPALNSNLYVGYSVAESNPGDPTWTTNHSGNGILLTRVAGALIEYCEAFDNGYEQNNAVAGGPVGIWTAVRASNVTIQYCISHDNKRGKATADGGGFDLDGGVTNSTIQYCYSYNNIGCGYLLYEYGSGTPFQNNVVRYNVSENDQQGGVVIGGTAAVANCQVYNNTIYNTNGSRLVYLERPENITNFKLYNNIFMTSGTLSIPSASASAVGYLNNLYYSSSNAYSFQGYSTLNGWADATGQEKLNGQLRGQKVNPLLTAAGSGERLTNPQQLAQLNAYRLQNGSPAANTGLNLNSQFSLSVGNRDFYGSTLPQGAGYDVGAHELVAGTVTPTPVSPVNRAANPGFEADGVATPTPAGWAAFGSTTASYTSAGSPPRSGVYRLSHYSATDYQVSTYQIISNLPTGMYTFRAWVQSSGGQPAARLVAKNFGGTTKTTNIVASSTYQQFAVTDINVTNGQCQIDIYSSALGGQFLRVDDVEFVAQSSARSSVLASQPATATADLALFPNPADAATVSLSAGPWVRVVVRDLAGRQCMTQPVTGAGTLVTTGLAAGLYVVEAYRADGTKSQQRLQVQK